MPFFNPFRKHDRTTFHGVVIPISSAPSHARPESPALEKKHSPNVKPDDSSLDKAPSQENGSAASIPERSHLTIEALRAEIESDVAASGLNSAYDRMFLLSTTVETWMLLFVWFLGLYLQTGSTFSNSGIFDLMLACSRQIKGH
jgi:hypothetical protein